MESTKPDVVKLTQRLVQISSTNTTLSSAPGTGEREIAEFVTCWLRQRGFEIVEVPTKDVARPSVLAVKRGTGGSGARSLLFNGHLDTVSVAGYQGDALSAEIKDGRIWGRGTADMKAGLAAAMVSAAQAPPTRGDVWIAAVADEEDASLGSLEVLQVCPDVEGAIFPEPTDEDIFIAHRGFIWFRIVITGKAAHGSLYQTGIDAIAHMGLFLASFKDYAHKLLERDAHPLLGHGSAHAGIISGGEETSTYPAACCVTIERRTLPGETNESVEDELRALLLKIQEQTAAFEFTLTRTLSRPPLAPVSEKLQAIASKVARGYLGAQGAGQLTGGAFWTDAALFSTQKGIESIVLGPKGNGHHTESEWVDIASLNNFVGLYGDIIRAFCG